MATRNAYLSGELTISVEPELKGKTLNVHVGFTRDLRRFFSRSEFSIRYEDEIKAGDGLLGVTATALVLPLAWLTGADIRIARLDRTFGHSAEALQNAYSAIYPKMPFGTRLIVDEWIDSPPNPAGSAMLYSGGLDATYTFFAKRDRPPRLIQVFGTEFPLTSTRYLDLLKNQSSAFARQHDVPINYIYTDARDVFDDRCVKHRLVPLSERLKGDLWKALGYAMGFLSMAAPLSAGRFDHLIISAWANKEHADRMRENPDSSSPRVDEKLRWSNLRVEHHGCLHRFEKVRAMKDWLPGTPLRVCWNRQTVDTRETINCNRCEKCARTIVALALGGVDPERCGFSVTPETVKAFQKMISSPTAPKSHLAFWWAPMQREIPEALEGEMFGLREFFRWFRAFDLGDGLDPQPSPFSIPFWYHRFPYPVSLAIRSVYYGIFGERRC